MFDKRVQEVKRLADADRLDEAVASAEALVTDFPTEGEAWRCQAYVFALRGEHERAIGAISSAIKRNSVEPHYYWTRGKYLLEAGDNEAAIRDLTETLRLSDEQNSDYYREAAYLLRAEANLRLRRYDNARRDCERVRDEASIWLGSLRTK